MANRRFNCICKVCQKPFRGFNADSQCCSVQCTHEWFARNPVERFLEKVQSAGPDDCWLWTAASDTRPGKGYGRFTYKAQKYSAPRFMYELAFGPVPVGLSVLHRCDNPPCVNPAHLFVGTQRDNMLDMERKGRSKRPFGSRHKNAKLTELQVATILYADGSHEAIAIEYGVSQTLVSAIKRKEIWKHVTRQ